MVEDKWCEVIGNKECDGTCEYCPRSTKKKVRKPKKKSKGE